MHSLSRETKLSGSEATPIVGCHTHILVTIQKYLHFVLRIIDCLLCMHVCTLENENSTHVRLGFQGFTIFCVIIGTILWLISEVE